MSAEERLAAALQAMWQARQRIDAATEASDPVFQRRMQVQAAKLLRRAANLLDDEGRLSE